MNDVKFDEKLLSDWRKVNEEIGSSIRKLNGNQDAMLFMALRRPDFLTKPRYVDGVENAIESGEWYYGVVLMTKRILSNVSSLSFRLVKVELYDVIGENWDVKLISVWNEYLEEQEPSLGGVFKMAARQEVRAWLDDARVWRETDV